MIAVFIGLLALSHWQYQRYSAKNQLIAQAALADASEPSGLSDDQSLASHEGAWVQVTGHYVAEPIIWMNRFRHHSPGVEVLWPFQQEGREDWVMVNLGWIPKVEKPLSVPHKGLSTTLVAKVVSEKPGFLLGQNLDAMSSPVSIQTFAASDLAQHWHHPVAPQILQLRQDQHNSYDRHWPLWSLHPTRHLAYAGQWALFALVWGVGCAMLIRRRGL